MRAVLERDFIAEGSRPRAFLLRTLTGATAAFLLAGYGLGSLGPLALDAAGAAAFQGILRALFLMLAVVTPALLAPSLLEERRAGTLDLLLASPVGVPGLVAGKLLARLGTVLAWAAAALPPLSLALLFGGTPWSRFFDGAAGLFGVALETAAFALVVSCGCRRPATAAVLAYLLPALHWGLVPTLTGTGFFPEGGGVVAVMAATSPLPFLEGVVPWAGLRYLLFALLLAATAVPVAGVLLLREDRPAGDLRHRLPRFAVEERMRTWLVRGNPVARKESLLLNTAWSRPLYYLVAGLLLAGEAAFGVLHVGGHWSPEWNQAWVLGSFTAVAVLAAVQGAASAAVEKQGAAFEVLRTTPLTPREIAHGKLTGLSVGVGFLLVIPLAHLALSAAAGIQHGLTAILTGVLGLAVVANFMVHGLAWGLVSGSVAAAILGAASFAAFSYGTCGLLCIAPAIPLLFRSVRKAASSWEFLGLIMLPAILCGPPQLLLLYGPLLLDRTMESAGTGPFIAQATFTLIAFALILGITALFVTYDVRRMPALLEREIRRLWTGEESETMERDRDRARILLEEARALERTMAEEGAKRRSGLRPPRGGAP